MSEQITLKPCPFCGSTEIHANEEDSGLKEGVTAGWLRCGQCGATICATGTKAEFVQVEGDLYRLVPGKSGLDAVAEKWNTRANGYDLSPVGEEDKPE